LFTTCLQLVQNFFVNCSGIVHQLVHQLVYDLFLTCLQLVHQLVHDLFMTCYDLFMTCSWLVYDLFMTCSRLVYDLFTTCSQLVCRRHTRLGGLFVFYLHIIYTITIIRKLLIWLKIFLLYCSSVGPPNYTDCIAFRPYSQAKQGWIYNISNERNECISVKSFHFVTVVWLDI